MKKQKKAKKEHDIKNIVIYTKKNYFFFYKIPLPLKSKWDNSINSIHSQYIFISFKIIPRASSIQKKEKKF